MNDGPANDGKVPKKERMRFVSAEQVAQRAGVSRSAVSRTFTPGASVAPATREKVLRAAEELGYHVNDLARGVLANQSRLVGIVATRPEVGFRAHLAAALAKSLIRRGSIPILVNTGQTEEELLAAQKMLIGHRAEAIIILSGSPPASFLELAQRNGQPLVVIGRSEPDADHVRAGNTEASRKAATAFYDSGRRRLAVIGSNSGTPAIVERENAFLATAETLGASVTVARGGDSDYDGGVTAGRALFSQTIKPDAVFCANDQIAFGLMDGAPGSRIAHSRGSRRHRFRRRTRIRLAELSADHLPPGPADHGATRRRADGAAAGKSGLAAGLRVRHSRTGHPPKLPTVSSSLMAFRRGHPVARRVMTLEHDAEKCERFSGDIML